MSYLVEPAVAAAAQAQEQHTHPGARVHPAGESPRWGISPLGPPQEPGGKAGPRQLEVTENEHDVTLKI